MIQSKLSEQPFKKQATCVRNRWTTETNYVDTKGIVA